MRVVFWGTPEFGHRILDALVESPYDVVGIVTQPDRPSGRGRIPKPPPVKQLAEEHGIDVLQPDKPRGDEFMRRLGEMRPDLSVVAAYGQILRQEVLDAPRLGSINVHASLLPRLRGAAPVNWAIINGDAETGVTIMRMVQELDAGPVLLQSRCDITPRMTAGELARKLAELGAAALLEALGLIESGDVEETAQDDSEATYAPKLTSDGVRINWRLPAQDVDRWIRGAEPTPGAWSMLKELRVRLFMPEPTQLGDDADPGSVVSADPSLGLQVATGAGSITILEVQPAGKRRMPAADWIRGRGVEVGQRFV